MSKSRSRLAADWFSKLRQNLQTGFVEHQEVADIQTEVSTTVNSQISAIETQISEIPPSFEAGVTMLFVQSSAPTGWTKQTTHNNKALRIVSGTAGSGGSAAFTTAFGTPSVSGSVSLSGTVGGTTLTTAQLASHNHSTQLRISGGSSGGPALGNYSEAYFSPSFTSTSKGSNSSHNHSFSGSGSLSSATASINVQYVDVIIATKD